MFSKKEPENKNLFFTRKSRGKFSNYEVCNVPDFMKRDYGRFQKCIADWAKAWNRLHCAYGRPYFSSTEKALNELMSKIDIESDHDHEGCLDIYYIIDITYNTYIRLQDSANKWKNLIDERPIHFSIDISDSFEVDCTARTPMVDIPEIVHMRLRKTWDYIHRSFCSSWIRKIEKETEELRKALVQKEFGTL